MKRIAFLLLLVVFSGILFADEAVIKSVKGKVEFSRDGSSWLPAQNGQTLNKGDFISTSFKSYAVILVNDSIVNVKPLTRMSIDDLSKSSSGSQTELFLVSGKVKVEVKPSPKGEVTTFTVKSAMATASVRCTGFEFDGENLLVNHGSVRINDSLGIFRTVKGGEFGSSGFRGKMPEAILVKKPSAPLITKDSTAQDIEKAVEEVLEMLEIDLGVELDLAAGTFAPDTALQPEPVTEVVTEAVLPEPVVIDDEESISQVTVIIK